MYVCVCCKYAARRAQTCADARVRALGGIARDWADSHVINAYLRVRARLSLVLAQGLLRCTIYVTVPGKTLHIADSIQIEILLYFASIMSELQV